MINFYNDPDDMKKIVEIITTVSMIDRFSEGYLIEYYERANGQEKNRLDIWLLRQKANSFSLCNEKKRLELVAELIPKEKIDDNFTQEMNRIKTLRNELDHNVRRHAINDNREETRRQCYHQAPEIINKPRPQKTVKKYTLQQIYDESSRLYKKYDDILRCFYDGDEASFESLFPPHLQKLEVMEEVYEDIF